MDDWDNSDEFIQRLDFSSCDEDSEDRSLNEEDFPTSNPTTSCEFQKWQGNSPLPATPQRKLSEIFPSKAKPWVSPTLQASPAVSKTWGNTETPLHITWKKLQLCDTPHTPKVMYQLCVCAGKVWGIAMWVVRGCIASPVESFFF